MTMLQNTTLLPDMPDAADIPDTRDRIDFALKASLYLAKMDCKQIGNLTIAGLAETMGMSVSSFYTHFENESVEVMTPAKFLLTIKIFFAGLEMIKNPDISVNKLAERLGFSSVRHFIRIYKEAKGMTPGMVLNRLRFYRDARRDSDRERQSKSRRQRKIRCKSNLV